MRVGGWRSAWWLWVVAACSSFDGSGDPTPDASIPEAGVLGDDDGGVDAPVDANVPLVLNGGFEESNDASACGPSWPLTLNANPTTTSTNPSSGQHACQLCATGSASADFFLGQELTPPAGRYVLSASVRLDDGSDAATGFPTVQIRDTHGQLFGNAQSNNLTGSFQRVGFASALELDGGQRITVRVGGHTRDAGVLPYCVVVDDVQLVASP